MISVTIKKQIKTYQGYGNLEVKASFPTDSITIIHGASGIGKTTFLKTLAGLIKPEEGNINVHGEIWFDHLLRINWSPQQRKTGFVFQDYALFPNMTVLQHLKFATKNRGLIQRLLNLGQLEGLTGHKPHQLSGGQQQRLAILRAIAVQPKVLLMDEPFSALDQDMRKSLILNLQQLLNEFKCTCLIVTHNPKELENIANHSLLIR